MSDRVSSRNRVTRKSSLKHNSKLAGRNSSKTDTTACSCILPSACSCCPVGDGSSCCKPLLLLFVLGFLAGIAVLIWWLVTRSSSNHNNTTPATINSNEANTLQNIAFVNQFQVAALSYGQSYFNYSSFNASGYSPAIFDYLNVIRRNEMDTANTWNALLSTNGYSLAPSCLTTFTSVVTVPQYMALLALTAGYENGVYLDLINTINSLTLKQTVMQVSTVTGQELSFLTQWANGTELGLPFPTGAAFQSVISTPTQMYQGLEAYYSCGSSVTLPTNPFIEYNGMALNVTNNGTIVTGPVYNGTDPSTLNYTMQIFNNDLQVILMALSVENLMTTFYQIYQAAYNSAQFEASPNITLSQDDYSNFGYMMNHHTNQVTELTTLYEARVGSTPAGPCSNYNFTSVSSVLSYVQTADMLEGIVKRFGTGIVNYLIDTNLQPIFASMTNLNSKHYAYLQQLIGKNATTSSVGQSLFLTPTQTVHALQNYTFFNCSSIDGLTLPQLLLTVPQNAVAA